MRGGLAAAASLLALSGVVGCGGESEPIDGFVTSKTDIGGSPGTPAATTTLTLFHCAEYQPKQLDCTTESVTVAKTTANVYPPGSFYPTFVVPTRQPISHPSPSGR